MLESKLVSIEEIFKKKNITFEYESDFNECAKAEFVAINILGLAKKTEGTKYLHFKEVFMNNEIFMSFKFNKKVKSFIQKYEKKLNDMRSKTSYLRLIEQGNCVDIYVSVHL